MHAPPPGHRCPAPPWAWAALPGLGGCAEAGQGLGGWLFTTTALLVVAGLAYTVGGLRERQRSRQALHDARTGWQAAAQLQQGWSWQTDAQHGLLSWRGPDGTRTDTCPLFRPAAPALAQCLQCQRAFADLRLPSDPALHGNRHWVLSGEPLHDAEGRFSGFLGQAAPADADEARVQAAAAQAPLLAAYPGPALLLLQDPQQRVWWLQARNTQGAECWPALNAGQAVPADWSAALPGLPAELTAAAAGLEPGAQRAEQGWTLCAYGPLPGGARGLLITRASPPTTTTTPAPAPPPAPAEAASASAAATDSGESDNFSFTVSHDLRAPIRVVEGFTRIVKEDYGRLLDRVGNDHLDRVLGAAARMNLMIDALLTLARLSSQPLARQPVNLSQLAQYVMDDLRRGSPEREAEVELEPGLVAQGDPTLLRLVLENLLGNAWKYSARTAVAQISLRRVPHENGLAFVVRDNGAGFDMRSADRLFGLFQRLHSASEFAGTGVGLASVRRIVQRHGGQIWAEAEVGRGAAFFFTLAP